MKNLFAVSVILILFFFLFCFWYKISEGKVLEWRYEVPEEAMECKLSKAYEYHGIYFAYCTVNGRWYFDRDGKKCKLLTDGFLKLYNKRRMEYD